MSTQQGWSEFLLPKLHEKQWTWQMVVLLCVAVFSLIDSFFVPFSAHLDPGRSGESALFWFLGIRASSRRELPTLVMLMGICLAVGTSLVNHGVLKLHGPLWVTLMIALLLAVLLWGRRLKPTEMPESAMADEKSTLRLPAEK
jgi:hypothetical protein